MTQNLVVATDGSAINNPHGPAGWAWYVDRQNWNYGGLPKASNQVAEIVAIYQALKELPSHIPLTILTDSQFWVSVLGENGKSGWKEDWKRRGWVKKDKKIPANLRILKAVDALINQRRASIKLVWIKGHAGHEMNSIADKLCTKASGSMKKGVPLQKGPGWVGKRTVNIGAPASPARRFQALGLSRKQKPHGKSPVEFNDVTSLPLSMMITDYKLLPRRNPLGIRRTVILAEHPLTCSLVCAGVSRIKRRKRRGYINCSPSSFYAQKPSTWLIVTNPLAGTHPA